MHFYFTNSFILIVIFIIVQSLQSVRLSYTSNSKNNLLQIISNIRSLNMQDSLQVSKLSPKRKSVSPSAKDDKERAIFQQIKQRFITALSKLQSSQTRQIGIQQIRVLVDRNRQSQFLRLYLSVMKSLKVQGTSASTKEHQILVFSILAEYFKENLVDPIDKPTPSRVKTCFRIIQILHAYFKQTTNTVQQACARVLIDLGKHVLGAQTENPSLDTQTFLNLLFAPLSSILKSGVDKASQSTASVCINQQIQYWKAHPEIPKYRQMLDKVCEQMLAVSLKLNCEYHEIFMALTTVIQIKGLEFFQGKIVQFVSKVLGVINKINNSKASQQDASNFNNYMCKVHVCGILQKIGELIQDKQEIKAKLDELDVIPCLEKAARNRVIQVQMAAARAIKVWNGQIIPPEARDKRPSSTPKISGGSRGHIMSLQQARNNKKRQRSGSKQQKLKLQRQLNHIQQDLHKLVKGGWGPHNRANNFVKKNTGVGGGYCSKFDDSPSPGKVNKSHKEHIEQLRKFIKQSSKQHGNKDKFVFYQEKDRSSQARGDNRPKQNNTQNNQNIKRQNSQPGNEKKKNVEIEQHGGQWVLDENAGDQMVHMPNQEYRNPYAESDISGRFDTEDKQWLAQNKQQLQRMNSEDLDGVMSEHQMKQLLRQDKQKQLLDIQSKPQIQSRITTKQLPQSSTKKKENGNTYGQLTFNTNQQPKMIQDQRLLRKNSKKDNELAQDKPQTETKRPIKAMDTQEYKKQNPLDNKLEKKVDNMKQNGKYTQSNSNSNVNYKGKGNQKGPIIMVGPRSGKIDEVEISLDGFSQKMSDSIPIADIMNQSDFQGLGWNPFKNKPNARTETEEVNRIPEMNFVKRKMSEKSDKQLKDSDYKDSLVLSISRGDSRSPPKPEAQVANKGSLNQSKKSQFSLNPKQKQDQTKKFNSYAQASQEQQEQILDQSKYEESLPYGQNVLTRQPQPYHKQNIEEYYKKSVEHGNQIEKRVQSAKKDTPVVDNTSQVYQQMIKNPPRSHIQHRLDKASHIEADKQSKTDQQSVNEQEQAENITYTWEKVLQHVENNQLNEAYTLTLDMDDPLYLLRLMLITQTPLKKLTPANTRKLWQKFLQIYQHRFIDNIFVQMFSSAHKLGGGKGLSKSLSIEQTNSLLIELYELSGRTKGKLSFGAASLYNEIEQSMNSKNAKY